ncbi:carbonic anhydrase 12 isoform X2 [Sphaerodactylus townsendi]|uniref:carbonic anhydrase 12 isoform X2 n=1 Tax=Sphaerodactylus townsendi TaxID=933632 RepID=UPI002026A122|nr:carbonic anhydrase 12 isoform X2 [Sphaerodactylus townsendi]
MTLSPTMRIRNLPNRYCAAQLHLHWGSQRKDEGSEHTVGGKRFAAELHIVHYNADQYRDMNSAADKSNGLAVLGILIQVGKFNPSYEKIFNHFRNVKYKGQNTPLSGFNIRKLLPDRLDEYYRYEGSLTTPPCYPSVVWTVFRDPVEISQKQLQALQTALYCTQSDDPDPIEMVDNFRRVQEFERMVSISFRQRGFVLPIVAASSLVAIAVLALALWLIRRTKSSKRPKEDQGVIYKPAISKEEENVSTA